MHTLLLIATGLGLGFGAAVPIGPVNVEIARRTLARGRAAGMALGFGAVTIDVLMAVATSLGLGRLTRQHAFQIAFGYAGVAVCFYLATLSLRAAWRAYTRGVAAAEPSPPDVPRPLVGDYATGLAMTGLNVYTWVWWFVTVPALAAQRAGSAAADLSVVCVGVAAAASAWVVGFTTIINALRRFAGRAWHVGADLAGGVLLLGFGFWALWRLVERPL